VRQTPGQRLRQALGEGLVVAPFVFDALQARLAQAAGLAAVYVTGFGSAAARGQPDLGLLGMAEMLEVVRAVAGGAELPAVCDADTGYGGPLNVQRTVREYERAGAAGLHLEDQVWPKRCGFFEGKEVVALQEMCGRLRAAADARRDPAFVLIARTDALAPAGWDEAERRARAYREAGADLVFVDGIRGDSELDEYTRRLGDLPLVYNGARSESGELRRRGVRLQLHPGSFAALVRATRDAMRALAGGRSPAGEGDFAALGELLGVLGVDEALQRARRYEG
jgi:2-methylisocitrate lyase-like PEP mutase family enzyme